MTNSGTFDFIKKHGNEDVRKLAFQASRFPEVDMPFALDQIAGRQMARTKLPSWAEKEDIIFPPHLSLEQCSSEMTARYKADVMKRWLGESYCPRTDNNSVLSGNDIVMTDENTIFCDFTAGFGVDFSFLAPLFDSAVYVEKQSHLCEIAKHNLPLLNLPNAKVLNEDGERLIKEITTENTIGLLGNNNPSPSGELERGSFYAFLDPARRDSNGGRTYAIGDCTPNILGFIDGLLAKCEVVMIKLSPMLDWHATVSDINSATKDGNVVREVHIVSVNNECKELLLVLSCKTHTPLSVICADLPNTTFTFQPGHISDQTTDKTAEKEQKLLLVPNASVMKAGCFNEVENAFGIKQVSINSHLFLQMTKGEGPKTKDERQKAKGEEQKAKDDGQNVNELLDGFPGRIFQILSVSSMNKKELKSALNGITKANISTRNFPISPEQLRKRLKLKDGGETYIFATTSSQNEHVLYICEKL